MDPISALSIATCVVQFVDFGSQMLTEGRQIYTDGRSDRSLQLSQLANDFLTLGHEVEKKSKLLQNCPPGSSQDIFRRLCHECKRVSSELEDALSRLRAKEEHGVGRVISSFVAVIKTIWSLDQIKKMKDRLDEIREQMMMAALVHMWSEASQRGHDTVRFAFQQAELIEKLDRNNQAMCNLSRDVAETIRNKSFESQTRVKRLIKTSWNSNLLSPPSLPHVPDTPEQRQRDQRVRSTITNSLLFNAIDDREEAIPEAHAKTFRWIFKPPRTKMDGTPLWSDFPKWLEGSSKDIYWITGKPGAGKSTLMKYISGSLSSQSSLKRWCGSLPVLIAGFYSWNAGTQLQKSRAGLLRSLLFQLLSADESLISQLCPTRWTLLQVFGHEEALPDWTVTELLDCFSALTSKAGKLVKLVLLIDGLDEFLDSHRDLIAMIHKLNVPDGVKVCVSSRPWNVFEDAYHQGPMLKLEDLTREDIDAFTRHEFSQSGAFRDMNQTSPGRTSDLLHNIASKARGVFLWVSIVVQTLLVNLSEGDRLSKLEATLDSLPDDLSELFQRIWDRIEPKYHAETSSYLQVIEAMLGRGCRTFLETLWLADEDTSCEFNLQDVTHEAATSAQRIVKRRLNSRTRGLIDIYDGGRVDYLHRTTRDWILQNWESITSKTSKEFDCNFVIFKALTIQVSAIAAHAPFEVSFDAPDFWRAASLLMGFAHAVRSGSSNLNLLLDRLDRAFESISGPGRYGFWNDFIKNYDVPHWTLVKHGNDETRIERRRLLPGKTWFLVFCAQVPICSYVKGKILEESDRSSPNHGYNLVLENAIFGFSFFNKAQSGIPGVDSFAQRDDRLELIRNIIQLCVFDPDFLATLIPWIDRWEHEASNMNESTKYQSEVRDILQYHIDQLASQAGQQGKGAINIVSSSKQGMQAPTESVQPDKGRVRGFIKLLFRT